MYITLPLNKKSVKRTAPTFCVISTDLLLFTNIFFFKNNTKRNTKTY